MIHQRNASDTLIESLEYIGMEKVRGLDIMINGIPLISESFEPYQRKGINYHNKQFGRYYIMTNTSTPAKKDLLEEMK